MEHKTITPPITLKLKSFKGVIITRKDNTNMLVKNHKIKPLIGPQKGIINTTEVSIKPIEIYLKKGVFFNKYNSYL
tara:strand:+ start:1396 stop:1623 length:228 start_codon:yes stop_codon:yes gene_type:complete